MSLHPDGLQRLLAALPGTADEIVTRTGFGRSTVFVALSAAAKQGIVECSLGTPRVWRKREPMEQR